ncbi:hypothetical protein Vafri_6277, partial [Volvox africanus]
AEPGLLPLAGRKRDAAAPGPGPPLLAPLLARPFAPFLSASSEAVAGAPGMPALPPSAALPLLLERPVAFPPMAPPEAGFPAPLSAAPLAAAAAAPAAAAVPALPGRPMPPLPLLPGRPDPPSMFSSRDRDSRNTLCGSVCTGPGPSGSCNGTPPLALLPEDQ